MKKGMLLSGLLVIAVSGFFSCASSGRNYDDFTKVSWDLFFAGKAPPASGYRIIMGDPSREIRVSRDGYLYGDKGPSHIFLDTLQGDEEYDRVLDRIFLSQNVALYVYYSGALEGWQVGRVENLISPEELVSTLQAFVVMSENFHPYEYEYMDLAEAIARKNGYVPLDFSALSEGEFKDFSNGKIVISSGDVSQEMSLDKENDALKSGDRVRVYYDSSKDGFKVIALQKLAPAAAPAAPSSSAPSDPSAKPPANTGASAEAAPEEYGEEPPMAPWEEEEENWE